MAITTTQTAINSITVTNTDNGRSAQVCLNVPNNNAVFTVGNSGVIVSNTNDTAEAREELKSYLLDDDD